MTAEAGFTDEEWVRVRRAPMVAGMAISLADPGGPIELSKETMASLRGVGAPPSQDELLLVVSQQVMAMGQQRENPMKGFEVADKSQAGAAVLQELRETQDIVEANATPEEAQAFARWMVEVAQDAADAAKEGGFMGSVAALGTPASRTADDARATASLDRRPLEPSCRRDQPLCALDPPGRPTVDRTTWLRSPQSSGKQRLSRVERR